MAKWEDISNDGWEDVKWEDIEAPQRASSLWDKAKEIDEGLMETAKQFGSGTLALVPAGIAGLATLPSKGLKGAVDKIEEVQNALTYQPQTEKGKVISDKFNTVMDWPRQQLMNIGEKVAGNEGQLVGDIVGNFIDPLMLVGLGKAANRKGAQPTPKPEPAPSNISDIISSEKEVTTQPEVASLDPQMELPLETTAQQIAERRAAQVGQLDLFGPINEAQRVLPEGGFDPRLTPDEESIARTQELNKRGQQMSIVEDFGSNDPMTRMPEMRVDENGMPIRADLSMEAQNLENPLQRNLWGDELGPALDQTRSLTDAIDSMPPGPARADAISRFIPPSQRGAVDIGKDLERVASDVTDIKDSVDTLQSRLNQTVGNVPRSQRGVVWNPFGKSKKDEPMAVKPPKPDTLAKPTKPETVSKKVEQKNKLKLLDLKKVAPEMYRVQTKEEALHTLTSDPKIKDVTNNPVRNLTISGLNGMIMANPKNPVLNFARTVLQDARNAAEVFSRRFVTGPEGIVKVYRDLTPKELDRVTQVLNEAGKQQVAITDGLMDKLNLSPNERKFVTLLRTALDEFYTMANDANMSLGFKPFEYRKGYIPAMFTGGYKALVGHYITNKDGTKKWVTTAVAQADTKKGLKLALEYYKTKGEKFAETIPLKRTKLRDTAAQRRNSMFDGFHDIINTIAANDPEFAKAKQLADGHVQNKIKHLYGFDVHELNKKGVEGALGDKPWLDRRHNSKEFIEGVIQFMEDGAKYYNYQKPLNEIAQLTNDASVQARMPNTLKYLEEHIEHVTGQNLNPIGAAANAVIDFLPKVFGVSYRVPAKAIHETKNIMSLFMMGTYNPAFFAAQLTQVLTGAGPEGLKIASALGQDGLTTTFAKTPAWFGALQLEDAGVVKSKAPIPEHIRAAYNWAKTHGMFTFNELELANEALKNKTVQKAEAAMAVPMSWGERLTRPAVFMGFVDLFKKFGLEGEEAFKIAQNSTNYAMGDYYFDERPHLYSGLGVAGHFMGALTTYKHNALTQWYTRAHDAFTRTGDSRHLKPFAYMLGMAFALQGISGLGGYNEIDQIVRWMTDGKTIREIVLNDKSNESSVWMDGALSASTGIDFQSRLSLANIIPDDSMSLVSPQLSALVGILGKAYNYGKYQDQQSLNDLLYASTPAGMKGMAEDIIRRDEEGFVLNKEGMRVHPTPRTETEWQTRKWAGFRPLRERIESDDVYADRMEHNKAVEKLRDLSSRLDGAVVRGDWEAYNRFAHKYIELGGNPETVYSQEKFEKAVKDAKLSERERQAGTPDNISNINKYQRYYD